MGPLMALGANLAGGALSGLTDILGGNAAASALKSANRRARTDLTQGYQQAQGYQQPLYDTGMKNYQSLSNAYGAGQFQNPHMDPYKFDPQSVFQDPEYQAQMRAGTEAINRHAQTTGNLFSGINNRDLTQFGQDLFAQRSDALYNRGFNAQNMAFNQNLAGNQQNFNQGLSLANPGFAAANNLSNLGVGLGEDLAANSQERGAIRAQNLSNTYGAASGFFSNLGNQAAGLLGTGSGASMGPAMAGAPYSAQGSWNSQINKMKNPNPYDLGYGSMGIS